MTTASSSSLSMEQIERRALAAGSLLEHSLLYPLSLAQARRQAWPAMAGAVVSSGSGPPLHGSSLWRIVRAAVRTDGVLSLQRGFVAATLGHASVTAWRSFAAPLALAAEAWCGIESQRHSQRSDDTTVGSIAATAVRLAPLALLTGSAEALLTTPFEVIKLRRQTAYDAGSLSNATVVATLRSRGVRSLYRGLPIAAACGSVYALVAASSYTFYSHHVRDHRRGRDPLGIDKLAVAMLSGVSAVLFAAPLDLIKSRVQSGTGLESNLSRIVANEGVRALYRGAGIKSLRVVLGSYIFLVAYEHMVIDATRHRTTLPLL